MKEPDQDFKTFGVSARLFNHYLRRAESISLLIGYVAFGALKEK